MRKLFIIVALVTVCIFSVFSSSMTNHLMSVHKNSGKDVLPVHEVIGMTANSSSSEAHKIVSEIMKAPFTLESADKYIDSSIKQAVLSVLAVRLQDFIPSDSFMMSEGWTNGDGSTGIRIVCKNGILDLAVLDGKVIALEIDEGHPWQNVE